MKLFSAWAFAAINVVSGVALLPFILSSFSAEEVNVWLLFFSVIGISEMVTIGFNATFTRFISYTYVGVEYTHFAKISKNKDQTSCIDVDKQLSEIYTINIMVFAGLGIVYVILVEIIGYFALKIPISYVSHSANVWLGWNIIVLSNMLRVMSYTFPIFIQGMNRMSLYYNLQSVQKMLYIVVGIVVLIFKPSILNLTLAVSGTMIFSFIQNYYYFRKISFGKIRISNFNRELFLIVWGSAWKSGISKIIAPIIFHLNGVIFAQVATPQLSSSYLLTERVFKILQNFTMLTFNAYLPTIARLRSKNELIKVNVMISRVGKIAYGIFVLGYVIFLIVGEPLISMIKSDVAFASPPIIALFSFAYILSRIGGFQLNLANQAHRIIEHKAIVIYAIIYFGILFIYKDNIDMWIFPFSMIMAQLLSFIYTGKISYPLYNLTFFKAEKGTFLPIIIILIIVNGFYVLIYR
jgi:hypothetical protein